MYPKKCKICGAIVHFGDYIQHALEEHGKSHRDCFDMGSSEGAWGVSPKVAMLAQDSKKLEGAQP